MTEQEFRDSLSKKSPEYSGLFAAMPPLPDAPPRAADAAPPRPRIVLPLCSNLGVGTGCQTRRCNKGHGNRGKEDGCKRCGCPPGHGLEKGVKPCDDCGPQCPDYEAEDGSYHKRLIVVELGAGGIGDAVLGMTAVAMLRRDRPEAVIRFQVSKGSRPFVELFDCCDELGDNVVSHSEMPVNRAYQMNLRHNAEARAKIKVPRWERYARNIGASGNIIPALKDPERVRAAGLDLAGFVVLCPFSTDRQREWSVQHWLTLEKLLNQAGYRTAVVSAEAPRVRVFRSPVKVVGVTAERLAGVMLNAAVVIGSDSGPAHLAGVLGTKTIVMGGGTPVSQIFGLYPRVRCIQGGLDCSGCCGGHPSDERCHKSCANLQSISPAEILAAVQAEEPAEGRTIPPLAAVAPEFPKRLDLLPELKPFKHFTEADEAESLRHLNADTFLYEPGGHRYICSLLGAVHQEVSPEREDVGKLVLEAVWMARRMNDGPGRRQEEIAWDGPDTLERFLTGGRSLLNDDKLRALRDLVLETNHIGGDVAELGVFRGGSAKLIGHFAPTATLHLFDTFAGIPENDAHPGGHRKGDFPADAEDVRRFLENPRAVFHVGTFPEKLPPQETKFRFAHIDADTYQSTLAAVAYFAPRMLPGGVMVLDDYGWHMCQGVERALRECFPAERIERGADGQAVIRFQ